MAKKITNETLLQALQNAGLPVVSATESGEVTMSSLTDKQREIAEDIYLSFFHPDEKKKKDDKKTEKTADKEYLSALYTQLQGIKDATPVE